MFQRTRISLLLWAPPAALPGPPSLAPPWESGHMAWSCPALCLPLTASLSSSTKGSVWVSLAGIPGCTSEPPGELSTRDSCLIGLGWSPGTKVCYTSSPGPTSTGRAVLRGKSMIPTLWCCAVFTELIFSQKCIFHLSIRHKLILTHALN